MPKYCQKTSQKLQRVIKFHKYVMLQDENLSRSIKKIIYYQDNINQNIFLKFTKILNKEIVNSVIGLVGQL